MNFLHISSSSSSSSDDIEFKQSLLESYDIEEQMITQHINNHNLLLAELLSQQNANLRHGGSVPGRRTIHRDQEAAAENFYNDYFVENPTCNEDQFRRHFRISCDLFLRVVDALKNHDGYFLQRRDAAGKLSLSTLQKVTVAIRVLTYAVLADATDKYIKIGESTSIECVKRFCRAMIEIFSKQYLRTLIANDVARLFYIGKQRGFPGMLGSLDCMHWKWKNCPTVWAGQYFGRSTSPTIILEVVVDYDL